MSRELGSHIELTKQDALSINDLVNAREKGVSVLRTPHVGNLSPYNLALAQAGIPLLTMDYNITGVDKNYVPEAKIVDGQPVVVADLGKLSLRARVIDGSDEFVDEVHIDAAREAVPGAEIVSYSEYFREHEQEVGEIATIAAKEMPRLFERVALPDGSISRTRDSAGLAINGRVLHLLDDPRAEETAAILPNVVNITSTFAIEVLSTERDLQYHISGPDMVRYINGIQDDLEELYSLIKAEASFGDKLPDKLKVGIVPAVDARLATTVDRHGELDKTIAAYDAMDAEYKAIVREKAEFFKSGKGSDAERGYDFIDEMAARKDANEQAYINQAQEIPEVFLDAGSENGFVTQYDVLAIGGLYVAQANNERSFSNLREMTARTRKLLKGAEHD